MDLGLKGKVILVAAASKGLGYGVARAVAHEGARVSICSREEAAIKAAGDKLAKETGAAVLASACDVRNGTSLQSWIDTSAKHWGGPIDGLLINAGGPPAGLFKELSDEQWQAAFELTLLSAVRMARGVLPYMKQGGSILVSTSSSVKEPIERLALSTVMRAGLAGLIKTLADELAGDKIRVNNLIPGRIDTDRVTQLDQNTAAKTGQTFEAVRKQQVARIPLQRLGTIDEYGAAAAFLLSPAAAYVTGATLRVDGGSLRSI